MKVIDTLITRKDLAIQNPTFNIDNIQFFIKVACEDYNRSQGTIDKSHHANIILSKELEMTKEVI
jgi:hypothetical protein